MRKIFNIRKIIAAIIVAATATAAYAGSSCKEYCSPLPSGDTWCIPICINIPDPTPPDIGT
ncbi:hypothetical protein GCM10009092_45420 [Bowmanella denitrificans]|uniref:Uncharacterized protein n=1 Tax=Bowmanella denitrificans TaxID=366582 RepID=A0ABP3HRJ7_9ALTE